MITLNIDFSNEAMTAAGQLVLKSGVTVPIRISTTRGGLPAQLTLSAIEVFLLSQVDGSTLAYCGTFAAENENSYLMLLDANDTRLIAALGSTKQTLTVNLHVQWTVAGETRAAASIAANVQRGPAAPGASEGGPVYVTTETINAMIKSYLLGLTGAGGSTNLEWNGDVLNKS